MIDGGLFVWSYRNDFGLQLWMASLHFRHRRSKEEKNSSSVCGFLLVSPMCTLLHGEDLKNLDTNSHRGTTVSGS